MSSPTRCEARWAVSSEPLARPLHWWIEGIDLASSSMQHLQTGGPFTFAGRGQAGALTFHVPLTDVGTVRVNGHILNADSFVVLREERPFVWSGSDACQWARDRRSARITRSRPRSWSSDAHQRRGSPTHLQSAAGRCEAAHRWRPFQGRRHGRQSKSRRHVETRDRSPRSPRPLEHSVPAGPLQRIGRPQLSRPKVIATAPGTDECP